MRDFESQPHHGVTLMLLLKFSHKKWFGITVVYSSHLWLVFLKRNKLMALDSRRKRSRSTFPSLATLTKKKARRPEQVVVASTAVVASSSSYAANMLKYQNVDDCSDSEDEESRARYLRVKTSAEMEAAAAGIVKANKRQHNGRPSRRGGASAASSIEPVRTVVPLHYGGKATVALTLAAGEVDADLIEMLGNTPNALVPAQSTTTPSPPRPLSFTRGKSDVDRYFVRHSGQKGWVSCVACGELQWPPNREKHLAKCPGLHQVSAVRAKA